MIQNSGDAATPSGVTFLTSLYIDNNLFPYGHYTRDLPAKNSYGWINESIGSLSAGLHTFKIVINSTNVFAESNELDNTFTRSRTISSLGVPVISLPSPLTFGYVSPGTSASKILTIGNTGNVVLSGTLSVPANSGYSLSSTTLNVAAGRSEEHTS